MACRAQKPAFYLLNHFVFGRRFVGGFRGGDNGRKYGRRRGNAEPSAYGLLYYPQCAVRFLRALYSEYVRFGQRAGRLLLFPLLSAVTAGRNPDSDQSFDAFMLLRR